MYASISRIYVVAPLVYCLVDFAPFDHISERKPDMST